MADALINASAAYMKAMGLLAYMVPLDPQQLVRELVYEALANVTDTNGWVLQPLGHVVIKPLGITANVGQLLNLTLQTSRSTSSTSDSSSSIQPQETSAVAALDWQGIHPWVRFIATGNSGNLNYMPLEASPNVFYYRCATHHVVTVITVITVGQMCT